MMKPVREISFFYRFMTLRKVIVRSTEYAQPILLMQGILVDGLLWVGKQWGMFFNTDGLSAITYPIALSSKPWAIIPTEGDPAGWQAANGIAVAGADLKTASNTQANILTKWVFSNGKMAQGGQTIRVFIIGT